MQSSHQLKTAPEQVTNPESVVPAPEMVAKTFEDLQCYMGKAIHFKHKAFANAAKLTGNESAVKRARVITELEAIKRIVAALNTSLEQWADSTRSALLSVKAGSAGANEEENEVTAEEIKKVFKAVGITYESPDEE